MSLDFEGPVEVIAHRGYSARAPENTLAAMELALEVGADALEFDIRTARDGTPFLFHDASLSRTTNATGAIQDWSPERLAQLDAGSWFDPRFENEPIPSLRHTLERVGPRVGRVYAEVKGYRKPSDLDRMVEIVIDAEMLERTVFISMDWGALARIRSVSRTAHIGYIVERAARTNEGMARAGGDPHALLDFDARVLLADPYVAERARAASIELATWTVNRMDEAARLVAMGVPRITTNEVRTLVDWKATL